MRRTWRDISLSWRLTALYVAILAVVLTALGVVLYVRVEHFLLGDTGTSAPIALLRASGPEPLALRHVTSTYGLEHLTTRIASFAVLELVMLSFVLAPLVGLLRRPRV